MINDRGRTLRKADIRRLNRLTCDWLSTEQVLRKKHGPPTPRSMRAKSVKNIEALVRLVIWINDFSGSAEIERLSADRRVLQATGKHPEPCARHCEATAFKIEIRRLLKVVGLLDSALKEAFPSGASGIVFERWNAARRIEKGTP